MAPKKAASTKAPGGKAKAAAAPTPAKSGGAKVEEWLRTNLATLEAQREAAVGRGDTWLEEPHRWHEARLSELLDFEDEGTLKPVPDEFREGLGFYVAQLADGNDTSEDTFYDDREMYGDLLTRASSAVKKEDYIRAAMTGESEAVAEQLRSWSDSSLKGISKMGTMLEVHAGSAGVQEAGLDAISRMARAMEGSELGPTSTELGLEPKTAIPIVADAMHRFRYDISLQKFACDALRSLATIRGNGAPLTVLENKAAELLCETMWEHMDEPDVVLPGVRAINDLTKICPAHSPEWALLCAPNTEAVLSRAAFCHTMEPRIEKMARVTIPFLRGS